MQHSRKVPALPALDHDQRREKETPPLVAVRIRRLAAFGKNGKLALCSEEALHAFP
jgi:hypothetical protein